MIESFSDESYGREHGTDRGSFLQSHRALSACGREFTRLADEVAAHMNALRGQGIEDKLDCRVTPGRCIAQLGPVALTLSWLRSSPDTAADGRLLVMAWMGTVASGSKRLPEHGTKASARTAETLWEETLVADASSEADWKWRAESDHATAYDSSALAQRCMEPIREALARYQQTTAA
ncbi:MAG: hypothetical protein ACYC3Q_16350 [Gemmatimonadaceae bacterium]